MRARLARRSRALLRARACSRRRRRDAHPLGNFSVNHLSEVSVSADRVDVRYVLDQAEIPTFQQRGVARAELLRRIRAEVARGVRVTVDGRAAALRAVGPPRLALRPGAGGLRTTRFELALRAPARDARRVVLRDDSFRDRVGWRAIVVRPGRGTAVRTAAPATDPTRRLTRYPAALLEQPGRPARGAPRRAPRRRHARRRRRAHELGGRERGGRVRRAVRRRRGRRGRAAPAPARRVRMGRRARALPRAREGDGRRLPRRHARDGAAGGRARRDGHRHPHRGRRRCSGWSR